MKKILTLLLITIGLTGFSQKVTNTWDGSSNYYWHNANNWSLNHIPLSTEDVVIPNGMPRYPSVGSSNEEINSLTIQSAAYVRIAAYQLSVANDVDVYGEIDMDNTDAKLVCDDIDWFSGSEVQTTGDCEFSIWGYWYNHPGADVQLDNGTVAFRSPDNQYIYSKDADCYFNDIWVDKTAAKLALGSASTATCKIKGNVNLYGSNYDFSSSSSQTIQIGGNLLNGSSTVEIKMDNGTIEFTDNSGTCVFRPRLGDYFYNLIVNTGSYDLDMSTSYTSIFEIKNDLTINSGRLDVNSMDLLVGGDWDNNVGSSGFVERDEKVTFNGSGHQYCSDETFYTLELDKSSGAFRTSGTDVVCAEYDWTAGAVDVLSGSFTANDLLDNAIQGKFYLNTNGAINLHNDNGTIDLNGDLYIYGGEFNVYGGVIASYWPFNEDASITMSDGVLDIKEQGIYIYNTPTYTLTDNITGGRIKCAGYLYNDRADFTPNAGIFEMYGPTDANIRCTNGGRFWDLAINKVAGKDGHEVKPFTDRDGAFYDGSKGNTAGAIGNIELYDNLYIDGGTLDMGSYDYTANGSAAIYGNLKMNSSMNDFNLGTDIIWMSGSTADITAGRLNIGGDWEFRNGTTAQLGTGNTVNFIGNASQFITSYDADAEFGSVVVNQTGTTALWLASASSQAIHIAGNLNIKNSNILQVESETLIVDGILDIDNGGILYLEDAGGELINNSNMNLTGKIEVDGGEAIIHGTFDIASTGELTVDGGSFGYDYGSNTCYIYGALNISDGLFFADETINIQSTADVNVSGGVLRSHAIKAEYANTFQPTGGEFECFSESTGYGTLKIHSSNYFHNLTINNPAAFGGGSVQSDLQINNTLLIADGELDFNGYTVTVDNDVNIYGALIMNDPDSKLIVGDDIIWKSGSNAATVTHGEIQVNSFWTFENGTEAQLGPGNIVRFIGTGSSSIYNYDANASFGSMSLQKSATTTSYLNGLSTYPIHCTGGLSLESNNTLHMQNEVLIVDQGIFIGTNAVLTMMGSGSLQNGAYMDIYGTLDIGDGEAIVSGLFSLYATGTLNIVKGSLVCNPSASNTNMQIKGDFNLTGDGLFEITNNNVQFFSTANTNISDGTIRIGGNFFATNAGTFQPTGGKVEMSAAYAGGQVFCTNGNYFHNLEITDDILVGDDLMVNYDLDISSGELDINSHTVDVNNDVNIYGKLIMTNSLGVLECGHFIYWMSGSTDNITAGNIYTESWQFNQGTYAMLSIGNTVHIGTFCINYDNNAEFGNLIVGPDAKSLTETKDDYTPIRTAGDCTIKSGLGWSTFVDFYIQGTLDIENGATLSLTEDNSLYTYSDFTLNGTLDLGTDGNGYVDGAFEIVTTGELVIEGGDFIVENAGPSENDIDGILTMTDGLFHIDAALNLHSSASCNISGGMIRTTAFLATHVGTFEPVGGIVEIQSHNNGMGLVKCSNGNFLYNLNSNPISEGGSYIANDLLVVNDLNILNGGFRIQEYTCTVQGNTTIHDGVLIMHDETAILYAGDDPSDEIKWKSDASLNSNNNSRINIFGDCTIEYGAYFNIEPGLTFSFVGTGDQNFYNYDNTTFGVIELDKPSGALIIPTGSSVECQSYNWTQGTFTLNGGNFTANDLADEGLFGTYNFNSGEAYFIQDEEQYPDLNGTFNIHGALVTIEGGQALSFWAYSNNTVFNMSSGEFNFIGNGVNINENLAYTFSENITGGTIRTNGSFYVQRPEFTPSGGTIELFGSSQSGLETEEGSLFNLLVNKTETDQGMVPIKNRKGKQIIPMEATNVQLTDNIIVNGTTTIESGQLETMGYDITCYNDVDVNNGGTLVVNPSSQVSMANTCDIDINSGGILEALGEAGNEAVFTHITGNYDVNINAGGTISASHAIFEYLEASGFNVTLEATIDPAKPLNNCTFRYGKAGGSLFIVNNDQTLTIDGAEFYTNGTENYNVEKVVNLGEITFTNFGGDFTGSAHEKDIYGRIHWFEPELSVSPSNQNVSAAAGTVTFNVTSNTDWEVTEGFDWLSVSPMSGSGNGMLTVNYDENISVIDRLASILLSADEVPNVTATVVQAGANIVLEVDPANRNVSAPAGTTTFNVTSNTSWTLMEASDWFSVSPMSGNGNGTFTVNYDENTTILSRIGSISILSPGLPNVNVTVTQSGVDIELTVNPANQNVGYTSGSTNFDILSNTSWTVSESFDWLSTDLLSGSGNDLLTVSCLENNTGVERVGEITITTDTKVAVVVTVTQSGDVPALSVDPGFFNFLAPNGIGFLNVYSNTNWTITDDMDWLGLNHEFPSGNVVVTVSVMMNNTGVVRTGEITLETEDSSIEIIIPVTQQPFIEHIISLPTGWSGLSSYAIPTPPFIEDVFAGIMDELVIALTEDEMYYPEYGVNTIGMWEAFSAYKIKINEAIDLEIYGSAYPNKTMTLPTGWSLLPVISECAVDVEDLFASVVADVEIVKDIAGYGLYWPDMGINNLSTLNPGKAYFVLTSNSVSVTFGDCAKAATIENLPGFENLEGLSPWELARPSAISHSIAILPQAIKGFEAGSIIGAFDADGNCFGITQLDGDENCLTIFADDELSTEKDGFAAAEQIFFKLYKPSIKEEFELLPEFDMTLPVANGLFAENGISAITGFKAGALGGSDFQWSNIGIYPNPSNGIFNITGLQSEAEIKVADIQGQEVYSNKLLMAEKNQVDLGHCHLGIYMVSIKQNNTTTFHKLILK